MHLIYEIQPAVAAQNPMNFVEKLNCWCNLLLLRMLFLCNIAIKLIDKGKNENENKTFLLWISLHFTSIHMHTHTHTIDCAFLIWYTFLSFSKWINKKFISEQSKNRRKNFNLKISQMKMKTFIEDWDYGFSFTLGGQSDNQLICYACYFHSFIYFFPCFSSLFSRMKSVNELWMYRTNYSIANQR